MAKGKKPNKSKSSSNGVAKKSTNGHAGNGQQEQRQDNKKNNDDTILSNNNNQPIKIPPKKKKKKKQEMSVAMYLLAAFGALTALYVGIVLSTPPPPTNPDGIPRDPKKSAQVYQHGLRLLQQNRMQEAIQQMHKSIELDPWSVAGYNSVAGALRMMGRSAEAKEILLRGMEMVTPQHGAKTTDLAYLHQGLFFINKDLGDIGTAIEHIKKAVEYHPRASYYVAWAGIETELTRQEQIDLYKKALDVEPNDMNAYCLLMHLYIVIGEWDKLEQGQDTLTRYVKASLNTGNIGGDICLQPYHASYMNVSARLMTDTAIMYARREANIDQASMLPTLTPSDVEPLFDNEGNRLRKLRIGYLSSDLVNHPVGRNFLATVMGHDKKKFEIYCFSTKEIKDDQVQMTFKQHCKWVDISLQRNFGEAARMIREEHKIDVLVDLNGWTAHRRLQIFAARPAPIQMTHGLGFVGSSGARSAFDYFISDAVASPARFDEYYTESVVRLPQAYLPAGQRYIHVTELGYDYDPASADKMALRVQNELPFDSDTFVFCSFQSMHKISKESFLVWMDIMSQSPRSVLWLTNHKSEDNLRSWADKAGIDPNRLIFSKGVNAGIHLVRAQACDLHLDSWPYNAHSTGTDILWAGVPLLVYLPDYHNPEAATQVPKMCSRVSASLLHSLNMPYLITSTVQEFISKAIALSNKSSYYNKVRNDLLEKRLSEPLYNVRKYVTGHEVAYEELYLRFLRGEKHAPLDVAEVMEKRAQKLAADLEKKNSESEQQ